MIWGVEHDLTLKERLLSTIPCGYHLPSTFAAALHPWDATLVRPKKRQNPKCLLVTSFNEATCRTIGFLIPFVGDRNPQSSQALFDILWQSSHSGLFCCNRCATLDWVRAKRHFLRPQRNHCNKNRWWSKKGMFNKQSKVGNCWRSLENWNWEISMGDQLEKPWNMVFQY